MGSVAFFIDIVGLDLAYAKKLNMDGAIRFSWVDRCQVVERLRDDPPIFDEDRVVRIRQRAIHRIDKARGFLYTSGCRRDYLLRYFGDESGGMYVDTCCDRCKKPE